MEQSNPHWKRVIPTTIRSKDRWPLDVGLRIILSFSLQRESTLKEFTAMNYFGREKYCLNLFIFMIAVWQRFYTLSIQLVFLYVTYLKSKLYNQSSPMFTNHSMTLCYILLCVILCHVLLSMQVIQCQLDLLENDACARQDLVPLCACIHITSFTRHYLKIT